MLSDDARSVCLRLQEAGHEAVFAGGCVRDRLLRRAPSDYDIATSARPEQVESLFDRTVAVGKKFGVVRVLSGDHEFEIATFRMDGAYVDGRRPETVTFSDSEKDAQRRDFTINALFEDPVTGETIDYVGGKKDLQAGVIRAVGDPSARFAEDRLRLLRGVRFAARFGFEIESATFAAMREHTESIVEVSAERIGSEVTKMLTEGQARRAFELLDDIGLLGHILPEILPMKGCEQTPDHHPEGDVFEHTLRCISHLTDGCSATLAYGVLLHDIAKPPCAEFRDGRHTFYGHTSMGAEIAARICKRMRLSNAATERIVLLVNQHLRHCSAVDMKQSTLKRFLRQEGIAELLELTRIDGLSANGDLTHYQFCMNALAELPPEKMRPVALVTGKDLIAMGLEPGPRFKEILRNVEDAQLEGTISDKEAALDLVRKRFA